MTTHNAILRIEGRLMRRISVLLLAAAALGCPPEAPAPEVIPPAPQILVFKASQALVKSGETVTLSWQVEHATRVEIREVEKGVISGVDAGALSGTVPVIIAGPSTFVLTAVNDETGFRDAAVATVDADDGARDVLFAAVPSAVVSGEPALLVWVAQDAALVTLAEKGGAAVATDGQIRSGAVTVKPVKTTTYTLTVDGTTHEATVNVTPSIQALSALPSALLLGEPVTVSWQTAGASRVEVVSGPRGVIHTETDPAKVADGSFVETIPADLSAGAAMAYTLRARSDDGAIAERTLTLYVAGHPAVVKWNVPPYARIGGDFTVSWETAEADVVEIVRDGVIVFRSGSAAQARSGSTTFATPAQDVSLKLVARNSRGGEVTSDELLVNPVGLPSITSFTSLPVATLTNGGDPLQLSWVAPYARLVEIVAVGQRTLASLEGRAHETGTVTTYPNKYTEYRLTVDNGLGDTATATVEISVTNPATPTFGQTGEPLGASVTLTGTTAALGGDVTFVRGALADAPGDAFVDISSTGTSIGYPASGDTAARLVVLPEVFETQLFGAPVSGDELSVSINGWFAIRSSTLSGPDFPAPFPNDQLAPYAIAPMWADFIDTANSEIYYQLDDVGADRRLTIQWNRVQFHPVPASELTFQAQVFSTGKVVFAYGPFVNAYGIAPSVGVVNGDETEATVAQGVPQADDVITFFGTASFGGAPVTVRASSAPQTIRQAIGTNDFIEIDFTYPAMEPGSFEITEVNYNPASGQEQWFEVQSFSSTPIDLDGWEIRSGGASHAIVGPLQLPAKGRLLFGQSTDSAEVNNGGVPVDYVYGTGLTLSVPGTLSLSRGGGVHAEVGWTAATAPGVSSRFSGPPNFTTAGGLSSVACVGLGVYGASGQVGTPGIAHPQCHPWRLTAIPGTFQAIAATGTLVPNLLGTGNGTPDDVTTQVNFTAAGGRAVNIGGALYGTAAFPLSVSSNGWIATVQTSSTTFTPPTLPGGLTSTPNGVMALFFDDLGGNPQVAGNPSGVYWRQFDPDGAPATGDEYTLISWENWKNRSATSSLNFQLKILEGPGIVEYHYGPMTSASPDAVNGSDQVIMFDSADGQRAVVAGNKAPVVRPNTGFRFTPY